MKTVYIILVIVLAIGAFVFYSTKGGQTPEQYAQQIAKEREEKDRHMKSDSDSPFAANPAEFTGLHYFEPDLHYQIKAQLIPIEQKQVRVLPTSDGKEKKYLEYAHVEFQLEGVDCRLLILEIMDNGPYRGTLFLAFADETSAHETYGAGRYLDLKKNPDAGTITLDFNKAYNPYCAYTDGFSCPFPPKENVLKVAIKAGETNYHKG